MRTSALRAYFVFGNIRMTNAILTSLTTLKSLCPLTPDLRPLTSALHFYQLQLLTINFPNVKSLTEHLWFEVPDRRGFINITPKIEELVHRSGVDEGLWLANAIPINASVFNNNDVSGLHHHYVICRAKLTPHAPINA